MRRGLLPLVGLVLLLPGSGCAHSSSANACQPIPVVGTSTDARGGKTATYANGVEAEQAPPAFNPLTASDEELRRYGIPPRPTSAGALAAWKTVYGHPLTQAPLPSTICETNIRN
ncbi:MAG: hypothetical protein ACJ735_00255 [Actinomycetes bacterium]